MSGKSSRTHRHLRSMPKVVKEKIENMPESFQKPSVFRTLADIVYCRARYGAGIEDYFDFRFYGLNHRGRKSFGTVRDKFAIRNYVNDPDECVKISDKGLFAQNYGDLTKRESFYIGETSEDSALRQYCERMTAEGVKKFILKPCKGGEGIGIFTLDADDPTLNSVESILEKYSVINEKAIQERPHCETKLRAREELIMEPVLENHPDIKKIHPASLNTIRIPVLFTEGHFKIIAACIRFGRDGSLVDNIDSGGMTAEVDLDTGVIMTPAIDHAGNQYIVHPTTGEIIVGLRIPFWDAVKELVLKAAEITPKVQYVGWDVAVTSEGPILIEGNTCGSLQIQQMPRHLGNRYQYKEVLKKVGKW